MLQWLKRLLHRHRWSYEYEDQFSQHPKHVTVQFVEGNVDRIWYLVRCHDCGAIRWAEGRATITLQGPAYPSAITAHEDSVAG